MPAVIWRTLLQTRLDQLRARLPQTLRGRIQVAVRSSGRTEHLVIDLRGRDTTVQPGLHPAATCWIDVEGAALRAWFEGGAHPELDVIGDIGLAKAFFAALATAPAATGFVGIRLGGAL